MATIFSAKYENRKRKFVEINGHNRFTEQQREILFEEADKYPRGVNVLYSGTDSIMLCPIGVQTPEELLMLNNMAINEWHTGDIYPD